MIFLAAAAAAAAAVPYCRGPDPPAARACADAVRGWAAVLRLLGRPVANSARSFGSSLDLLLLRNLWFLPGLAGSRGVADPRPATCDPGRNQRPATRDPDRPGPPGPARTYPVRPGHTWPGPDICQDRDFKIIFLIAKYANAFSSKYIHRFETNVFGKAVKESNYNCDCQCPSPILWCE